MQVPRHGEFSASLLREAAQKGVAILRQACADRPKEENFIRGFKLIMRPAPCSILDIRTKRWIIPSR